MHEPAIVGFTLAHGLAMLVIAAASGLVHGFVGVGFPLVATPLFGLMFGWRNAVTLLVLPTWLVTACALWAFRGEADLRAALRRYWPLAAAMPFGLVAGVEALHRVDSRWLMLLMAAVIVVYLVLDRLGRTDLPAIRSRPTAFAVPFGLLAGFCEGSVNVAGPALLIYFLLLDVPVGTIIALVSWLFLLGKTVQAALMAQHGAFDAPVLGAALPLALAGALAYAVGLRLRSRVDPSRYRGWLKATLAAMAAALVVRVAAGGAV
jgi:uncharacterized membrane protein YfcA